MRAGQLRHRLTLQRRADTQSNSGEVVPGYETLDTVWGNIKPLAGREFFAAQQVQAEVTTEILIRWRPGINSTIRIRHRPNAREGDDDTYDVLAVAEDNVSGVRQLRLMCVKRDAEGWRRGPG